MLLRLMIIYLFSVWQHTENAITLKCKEKKSFTQQRLSNLVRNKSGWRQRWQICNNCLWCDSNLSFLLSAQAILVNKILPAPDLFTLNDSEHSLWEIIIASKKVLWDLVPYPNIQTQYLCFPMNC